MNERMVDAAVRSLSQADLVLWLVDVTQEYGPGDRHVRDVLKSSRKTVVLGINKIDAVPKPSILPVIERYRHLLELAEVVPLSALSGENAELLGERLLALLPEGEPLYPEDFLTDQPERFFVAELIRERILQLTREEIPYATGVVIESFKEEAGLTRIEATVLVEREGQKGILIGKGGSMLKRIGSEARQGIEAFLGAKVYLGLFVKLRENWRDDQRILEQMGLGKRAADA
jgi:GTP-binding protein Era